MPLLGWGQCPYLGGTSVNSATTIIGAGGVKSPDKVTISHDVTVSDGVTFVVSGTLELNGNIITGKNSNVYVCSGGVLVIRGNLTLGNQADILVKTGGVLIVLGNVDGLQGNINLDNDGKIILAGTTTLNPNTSMSGSTGASYIFDSAFVPKVGAGGTVGNFDDLVLNDSGLLDLFSSYSCPSMAPLTLTSSLNGSTITLTASSGQYYYDFYVKNAGPPASVALLSAANNTSVIINFAAASASQYVVYAKSQTGTCFQAATAAGFTIFPLPAKPTTPTGTTPICQGTASATVQTTATSGANTYSWSIVQQSGVVSPGTISGTGTAATITWNPLFSGVALVSVTGVNGSGVAGVASSQLSITVNPKPTLALSNVVTCAGQQPVLGLTAGYSSYSWSVTTPNFTLTNAATATPALTTPDNDTLFPVGTPEIVVYPDVTVTVTDANGCVNSAANSSTDKLVAIYRIPRTGATYHIGNDVAK